jgi:sterol 3beta-glucosyltransferase
VGHVAIGDSEAETHFLVTSAHTRNRFIINNGHFAVNAECVGFYSRSIAFGRSVCYRVPIVHVRGVKEQDRCKFGREHTLAIEVQGRRDLLIQFFDTKKRDAALEQVNRFIGLAQERLGDTTIASPTSLSPTTSREEVSKSVPKPPRALTFESVTTTTTTATAVTASAGSPRSRRSSRSSSPPSNYRSGLVRSASSVLAPLSRLPSAVKSSRNGNVIRALFPKAINVPDEVLLPMPSRHFVCLTIGSRGDVQPYIALGKGLQKEGHRVTIVTHEEYKEWVTGFGIDHRTAGGDPGALMKLSVENKVSYISRSPLH